MAQVVSKEQLAQASGAGGFVPGVSQSQQPVIGQSSTSSFLHNLVPDALNLFNQFAAHEQDQAFIQGQADTMSGMVRDQSWLTQRAYDQGIKYQTYTDELANFPVQLRNVARESIDANENLDQYTTRIQPYLAQINTRISELGLTGAAKEAAQKQMMTTLASAQKTYQTEMEQETFRRVDQGNSKVSATAIAAITVTDDPNEVTSHLTAAYDNTYETSRYAYPKQANDMASKNVYGALKVAMSGLNAADPKDLDKLRAYETYLRSPEASRLTPDIRSQAIEAVNNKFLEVRAVQQVYDDERIREIEDHVNTGQPIDIASIDAMQGEFLNDMRSGRKTPQQANQAIEKLQTIKDKANKDMGMQNFLVNAQKTDLLANGKTDADQTTATLTAVAKQYPGDYTRASISAINYGMQQRNMGTIKAGAELATSQFMPALTMSGAELKEANDGQQGKAFKGFVERYREAGVKNSPGMQAALLEAVPQADRPAVEFYLRNLQEGASIDLRTAAGSINTIKGQLKEFEARGGANSVSVDAKSFKSKFWLGGSSATAGAELGYQPNDTVLELNAAKATGIVRSMSADLASKGYVIHDGVSGMQALVRENRVLRSPSGPVFINPNWVKAVGVQSGVASDNEQLVKTIRQYQVNYAAQFGGRVSPDDVFAEVRGTDLALRAYDKSGNPVALKNQNGVYVPERIIAPNQVQADLNATIKKDVSTGGTRVIALARAGKQDFNITADWGIPFKSNALGAAIGQHLAHVEGYVDKPTQTDPRYTKDQVIGIGINVTAHPAWKAQLMQAQGNPQALAEMTGKFVKQHYKNWDQWLGTAGIPGGDSTNAARYRSAHIALADAAWHGGEGGGEKYASILSMAKTDKAKAMSTLQQTAFYKQSQPYRKQILEQGIKSL